MLSCGPGNGALKSQLSISVHQLSTCSSGTFWTDLDLSEAFCQGPMSISWAGSRLLSCYVWRVNSPATWRARARDRFLWKYVWGKKQLNLYEELKMTKAWRRKTGKSKKIWAT